MSTNQHTHIIVGISGSIAAYKACDVVSTLVKQGFEVSIVATQAGLQFAPRHALRALAGKDVVVVEGIDDVARAAAAERIAGIVERASVFALMPASANTIAHIAHDAQQSAVDICAHLAQESGLVCVCAPAMNTNMYTHPATQDNLAILRARDWLFVEPVSGVLACKDEGVGKLGPVSVLVDAISFAAEQRCDLTGKKVVVSAGPTQESIDPVRYITNRSTGTMGFEIARRAAARGAEVVLVSGPSVLTTPFGVNRKDVISAQDMFEAIQATSREADIVVMSAAVADFTPMHVGEHKLKKDAFSKSGNQPGIQLQQTQDILAWLGAHRQPQQYLVGFAMETQDLLHNAQGKRERKGVHMIVANNLHDAGAGFGTSTNKVAFVTKQGIRELPLMSKGDVADALFDEVLGLSPDDI